eukprot:TRINITY_DN100581_c0_g1_i1.p1 TRINITY_DN100581_c0_g1~~TRINITY_DN100581_c0_g1_i1.p1  ORF type:complete len:543 (+),score=94.25 TRINITY_DN100581_c0_g1_i1:61-1689(+)
MLVNDVAADSSSRLDRPAERPGLPSELGIAAAACSFAVAGVASPLYFRDEGALPVFWKCLPTVGLAVGVSAGALGFGELADKFGRRRALCSSAAFMLLGQIGCACSGTLSTLTQVTDDLSLHLELSLWQLLLGIGTGGEIVSAFAYTAEASCRDAIRSARFLARLYFSACAGSFLAAVVLLICLSSSMWPALAWRMGSAVSATLSLCALGVRLLKAPETSLFTAACGDDDAAEVLLGGSFLAASWKYVRGLLCGMALTACIYAFVLTALSLPLSSDALLMVEPSGQAVAQKMLMLTTADMPGYIVVFMLWRWSRRACQLVGFGALAVVLVGLALFWEDPNVRPPLYLAARMLAVGGPGACIVFVPTELLPSRLRGIGLGIITAAVTLGAMLAYLGVEAKKGLDARVMLALAAVLCLVGAAATALLTPRYDRKTLMVFAQLGPSKSPRESTERVLESGSQFRECPICQVMTERTSGCNIVACANCRQPWCFACGSQAERGCKPWACVELLERHTEPDVGALPRLLWARPESERAVPLVAGELS